MTHSGTVYLVGAGPGDPRLITLRGQEVLARADVVLYDYLVNPQILRHAAPSAEMVCLGRHGHGRHWSVEAIQTRMLDAARQGKTVVRLKSGDSLVFGRAADEMACLTQERIPVEIVPGISAALAAASYAGVPLTDRHLASAVAFVTGQETASKEREGLNYRHLAPFPGTLVIYMGVTTAATWTSQLIEAGMPADRPVALIRRCSWPDQQVIRCRLDEVPERVTPYTRFPPPVIAIVGEVAAEPLGWHWFERRPLFGETVLITRPSHQSGELQQPFAELGAEVLEQPAIEIQPPPNWRDVDSVLTQLDQFEEVVFSSANGVDYFLQRLLDRGRDMRALASVRLAAIGPGTAQALSRYHLHVDLQPDEPFRAESLLALLAPTAAGKRVLLVRASRGRELLAEGLRGAGAQVQQVVAYRSLDVTEPDSVVAERLPRTCRPWITVTSSAIARSTVKLLGNLVPEGARWASISPLTSAALREAGIEPAAEATTSTMQGLVEAVLRANASA